MWSYYDWFSLLSSVSKHTIWSYYDWIYCCFRSSVNTICGRIMIGLSLLSSVSKLLTDDNNDNPIIIRPHIVFTDGRQQLMIGFRCFPLSVNIQYGRIMIGFIVVFVRP
jgi:hypothetical protein